MAPRPIPFSDLPPLTRRRLLRARRRQRRRVAGAVSSVVLLVVLRGCRREPARRLTIRRIGTRGRAVGCGVGRSVGRLGKRSRTRPQRTSESLRNHRAPDHPEQSTQTHDDPWNNDVDRAARSSDVAAEFVGSGQAGPALTLR